tara:strand:- start:3256 stop:3450 length:195 start_codon:yes stop_codon:yes gene_type:complete
MAHDDVYCTRCDALLDPDTAVWLELDLLTDIGHPEGAQFPVDGHSHGWFAYGSGCAKKVAKGED